MKRIFKACMIAGVISGLLGLYLGMGIEGSINMAIIFIKAFVGAGIITFVANALTYGVN